MGLMDTYKSLDEAVSAHLKEATKNEVFPTGWVLVASISSVMHDIDNTDGYMTFTSEGLPHHSHIGLLQVALDDRKNISLISLIHNVFSAAEDEEGEGD